MSDDESFRFADTIESTNDAYLADIPAGLKSSEALLRSLGDRLSFSDYFSLNWNALSECLRDLEWIDKNRVILRHADLPAIPTADLRIYLDVLGEAQDSWKKDEAHTLEVFFPPSVRDEVVRLVTQQT